MAIQEIKPRQIALAATVAEVQNFEVIKKFYRRRSDSDTLRFLIDREAEKILSQNVPTGISEEVNHDC